MRGAYGLTELKDKDLENILRALHNELLECPVTPRNLACAGLTYLFDKVDFLQGLEEPAVRAVVIACIAERRNHQKMLDKLAAK